jgi:hypothetical protein
VTKRTLFLVFSVLYFLVSGPSCGSSSPSAPEAMSHFAAGASGAGFAGATACPTDASPHVVINEISSNNDGNAVDEQGNADDWLELVNRGPEPASLGTLTLTAGSKSADLPDTTLEPGARVLLWADEMPSQGPTHLPFRLSAGGVRVTLRQNSCVMAQVDVPALATNQVYARFPDADGTFSLCRYATPSRSNGASCVPPAPPPLVDSYHFSAYNWQSPYPTPPSPLVIDELGLRPASFIELRNDVQASLALSNYHLRLAPIRPGQPWPTLTDGVELPLDMSAELAPGERIVIPVTESDMADIAAHPQFEGVATLFAPDGSIADRVDFARWPSGAVLARTSQYPAHLVFCSPASPGSPNDACALLERRDVGDYVRHLRTASDFEALAAGGGELGMASVKFILDMAAGNQIYLVGWRDWSLHYDFIRQVIDGQPALNRCDEIERATFDRGWYNFSVTEYFQTEGRRYLLGTLVHHASTDLYTVEFALGDEILPEDMLKAFFAATAHTLTPERFYIRPQDADQTERALTLDGTAPIVGPNAPFADTKLQPLTAAVGYGVLTYVPAAELSSQSLGPDVILITNDVPNDIPLVGGLITEAFQTPLSHINVLCQNRGTPNLALPLAHEDPALAALLGQLVRFEVTADAYHVAAADPAEAQAFWDAMKPSQTQVTPRLDTTRTGLVDLHDASLDDLPAIGAKAAQLAELVRLAANYVPNCSGAKGFEVPDPAFAIPMAYFAAHAERSGARASLQALLADPEISTNRNLRHQRLATVRDQITTAPVDPDFLQQLTDSLRTYYGSSRVRFRSSSNAEDLPGFNGAGLYTSVSAAVDDPAYPIADALREVWASMYSDRGFDERLLMNVDQLQVAMGVLVHPAFPEERANGVVISRNLDDVTRGDMYSFNIQLGEASVTNPAPGVASDQFTYQWPPRSPAVAIQSVSSFNGGNPILGTQEIISTACALRAIVDHFRPMLDPDESDAYFTMDMEMKLLGDERRLLIKQARPFTLGSWRDPGDCRQF